MLGHSYRCDARDSSFENRDDDFSRANQDGLTSEAGERGESLRRTQSIQFDLFRRRKQLSPTLDSDVTGGAGAVPAAFVRQWYAAIEGAIQNCIALFALNAKSGWEKS